MSTGLRYLFDRNNTHLVVSIQVSSLVSAVKPETFQDIFTRGWHPPVVTIIILAVSLALMYVTLSCFFPYHSTLLIPIYCRFSSPVLSFAQHKIFKGPFKPERPETMLEDEPDREPLQDPSSPITPTDTKTNQTSPSTQALLEKDSKSSMDGDLEKQSNSRFST